MNLVTEAINVLRAEKQSSTIQKVVQILEMVDEDIIFLKKELNATKREVAVLQKHHTVTRRRLNDAMDS